MLDDKHPTNLITIKTFDIYMYIYIYCFIQSKSTFIIIAHNLLQRPKINKKQN